MRQRITAALMIFVVTTSAVLVGAAPAAAGDTTAETTDEASVTFNEQMSGGYTITVNKVSLPDGGFVTIHDSSLTDGDTLGSVVGTSAYLEAGTHENVTITLDKSLSEDDTLHAMAHQDTDGDRAYTFVSSSGQADGPYTADDNIVMQSAGVTVSATVSMTDQPTDGTSVVVYSVELSEGGFVTIHDGSLLDGATFDSIRGTSEYLEAGHHENVRVQLDEPLGEDATVIPMPHQDSNDNEMYDFVEDEGGADGPYADDDGAIVDTAATSLQSEASATFAAQTTGSNHVTVEQVFVPEGGFVTMHDSSINDGAVFDSVRGTSEYLEPGLHRNVMVALDDPLNEDDSLVAMPHMDSNDNEMYDFVENEGGDDGPYADDNDAVVDSGTVTVLAAASISDQESDGTIVVDSVTLHDGGFVTVHDRTVVEGAVFDSVRGTSEYLGPGTHEDVEISLDEPYDEDGVAVAMPHQDTNDNEMYDFIDSEGTNDGPYVAAGGAVVADAAISASGSADDGGMDDEDTDDEGMNDEGMNDEEMNDEEMDNEGNSDDGSPGFGIAIAAVSLLAAAMLALRRSYQ
jgi:PGF-CTERM protein